MKTIKKQYRVDRYRIAYLKFILEAYEGIANVTTLNALKGIVQLSIAPGCEVTVDAIIDDLKRDTLIEPQ